MSQKFGPIREYIIGAVERINEINNYLRSKISEEKKERLSQEKEIWKSIATQLEYIIELYEQPSAKPRRANRSAKSGKFVTKAEAAANPDTTFKDTFKKGSNGNKRR